MLNIFRNQCLFTICCTSLWASICQAEPSELNIASVSTIIVTPSTGTCPSASINYITHGLLQQCLRNSPTASTHPIGTGLGESYSASTPSAHNVAIVATTATSSIESRDPISTSLPASSKIGGNDSTIQSPAESTVDATNNISEVATTESSVVPTTVVSKPSADVENETDSLLDNSRFLSFEEWKKENLAQVGQSVEALGQGRRQAGSGPDRGEAGINHGLDTLGDDSEIELNFGGFGGATKTTGENLPGQGTSTISQSVGETGSSLRSRSKDAGKTSKERFNYASFDCAANVLKTNSRCKGATRILSENKDSYMLNECKVDGKFLVVELCDDILIDTIVLANFEFFSSMFRTFKISVSDRYPIKAEKWKELGIFEARNSREVQAFLIESPLIWASYLKIDFITHYGSEFYCPVSLLRVHGTTMMEEYRREELGTADGDDDDDGVDEPVGELSRSNETLKPVAHSAEHAEIPVKITRTETLSTETTPSGHDSESAMSSTVSNLTGSQTNSVPQVDATNVTQLSTRQPPQPATLTGAFSTSSSGPSTEKSTSTQEILKPETTKANITTTTSPPVNTSIAVSQSATSDSSSITKSSTGPNSSPASYNETVVNKSTHTSANATSQSSNSNPSSTAYHVPTASSPATQESFFKSINKRLQALEANATLSLQYIEAQSQLLRDAFGKVEKRQLSKTTTFLDTLNATVTAELARFKSDYDQLWQSTVLELAAQREEGKRQGDILGERVRMLAEEMVGQKRIMVAQATALLFCASLLIFTRVTGTQGNGEAALMLGMQNSAGSMKNRKTSAFFGNGATSAAKSPGAVRRRWKWDSPWTRSPAGTPRSPDVRSDGEAEDEELDAAMARLRVDDMEAATPTQSPSVASPVNEVVSEEEDSVEEDAEEADEQQGVVDEGESEDMDGQQDTPSEVDGEEDEAPTAELGARPGIVGTQSAPTVPSLASGGFDGVEDVEDGVNGEVELDLAPRQ